MYAQSADLVAAWGQDTVTRLSVRDGDPTGATNVAAALTYATGLIDAQLSVRFALPLSTVPQALVDICVDMAIDRLANSADQSTEIIRDRAKSARANLDRIADGKMHLGLPAKTPGESPRPVLARTTPGIDKIMTRETLRQL